jgi:hypothetical protein
VSREDLIARKEAIHAELARTRRTLERTRAEIETASRLRQRFLKRRLEQLETRADALMSEEYRLRQLIDQSR